MLTPRARSVAELTGMWWVGVTAPNYEKEVARRLNSRNVAYFLPMEHVIRRIERFGGRRRVDCVEQYRPLFPRYIFVCGDDEARWQLGAEPKVVDVIEVHDQAKLINELAWIEAAVSKPGFTSRLAPSAGARCMVKAGPLMGQDGFIECNTGKGYVSLRVSMLGQSVSVEIDPALLEPIG